MNDGGIDRKGTNSASNNVAVHQAKSPGQSTL
jgi:hypothetical protein